MGKGPLCGLLLLLVGQTNSAWWSGYDEPQKYEGWNYGRNQVIQDFRDNMAKMNDRFDNIENTLNELKKEIQTVRRIAGIPLTHDEKLAKLSCPKHFEPVNSTLECILVASRYATYKEATESCEKLGAHLAVPKDIKILREFLIERDSRDKRSRRPNGGPQRRQHRGPSGAGPGGDMLLSHDVFWIGADNNLGPDQMRWVDGKPVDTPITVFSTEYSDEMDDSITGNLCGVLPLDKFDDDDFGEKLSVKPCAELQRYPYICEIDSGSETVEMEGHDFFTEFVQICPADFKFLPAGECLFVKDFNLTLDYFKASEFCSSKGASLMHPNNLTFVIELLNLEHKSMLVYNSIFNSSNSDPIEYGIWFSNSVVEDDQDWADLMQEKTADAGRDMCTLLKAMPSEAELHKDVASCSSSQRFLCTLNVHPKIGNVCSHRRC